MREVLIIIGAVGTILEGIGVKVGRVSPGWLGLAAFIISFIV